MRGVYDVHDFGAIGDGTTNDLAALQAAVDAVDAAGGGTVWLGPGRYNIGTGTWKIGQANSQHHINVEGINLNTSAIVCDTSDGHAAIYFNLEKYVYVKNFSVINQGAKGGYGMQLGGDNGLGTQTNGNIFQQLFFQNFKYGLATSGGIGTSSEIVFNSCIFSGNDYGFYTANFNGLNYVFTMLEMYDNTVAGVYSSTANITVVGGASNNNGNDFYIAGGNDGQTKLMSFRAQQPTGAWLVCAASNYISVEDCIVHPRAAGVEVIHSNPGGNLYVRNCTLGGYITWNGFMRTNITLDHVSVFTPGTDWSLGNQYSMGSVPPYGPGFKLTNNTGYQPDARVLIRDVYEGSNGTMYPDLTGRVDVRPSDNMRIILVNR